MKSAQEVLPLKESGEHSYHRRSFYHDYHNPFIYHIILKRKKIAKTLAALQGMPESLMATTVVQQSRNPR